MDDKKIGGIRPVGRQPLNQKVYESLKMSILCGNIAPGVKLSENQVALQMDTSTTPVREAFRMLAAEGLVKIEPWKGVVVQEYSTDEIVDVFQCREIIETLALDLTITRLEQMPSRADAIRKIDKEIVLSQSEAGTSTFVNLNSRIHDFWIRGAGNQRLVVLMDNLNDVLLHDRNVSAMDETRKQEIVQEHQDIFLAIRELNRERAKEALIRHIRNGCAYSLRIRGM
ncbi:MAG: GntR family transcriptional regulator [Oscillospiraceae bacterium]